MKLKDLKDKMLRLRNFFNARLENSIKHDQTNTIGFCTDNGTFHAINMLIGYLDDMAFDVNIEEFKNKIEENCQEFVNSLKTDDTLNLCQYCLWELRNESNFKEKPFRIEILNDLSVCQGYRCDDAAYLKAYFLSEKQKSIS